MFPCVRKHLSDKTRGFADVFVDNLEGITQKAASPHAESTHGGGHNLEEVGIEGRSNGTSEQSLA